MVTMETPQLAEKRFHAEAETNPAVDVRWHTVAFTHKDVPTLFILGEILNGPTGRLNRRLVLEQGLATSARTNVDPRKYEGMFEIHAECKEGTNPTQLESAIHAEVAKLAETPVGVEELKSAQNRYVADNYRRLTSNFQIMLWYGIGEGRGSWRDVDRIARETQNVTVDDVQRVVKTYFTKENRAVALWNRKAGAATEDPALAALPPQAQGMARQMLAQIQSAKDPVKLEQAITQMDAMGAQMPPEMKPALDYIKSKAQQKLDELKAAGAANAGANGSK
jgi:predicted Zn-dependent peptidase